MTTMIFIVGAPSARTIQWSSPIHVQKLYARESGDPAIDLEYLLFKVRVENPIGVQQ